MGTRLKQQSRDGAFTIIELLTVMSIIVILIGLLVPALNQVRRYALGVKQNAQFNAIRAALELYRSDFGEYPESGAVDGSGARYCGAMKLCEAMMGQDLLGFHPQSRFLVSQTLPSSDPQLPQLYRLTEGSPLFQQNLKDRKGPFLESDKVSAHMLSDIFSASGSPGLGAFTGQSSKMYVLCDVYNRQTNLGSGSQTKVGMPVLYYRADLSGTLHDPNAPTVSAMPTIGNNNGIIYNYTDNKDLLDLGRPGGGTSQLNVGLNFYSFITNPQIIAAKRPYQPDSYILISAGWDGEYGTQDDIANFQQK
jgi:type II secretory pathway pseudopilin PulG